MPVTSENAHSAGKFDILAMKGILCHWIAETNMDFNFQAQEKSFAHTAQVLRTMEAVAVAISQKESTLLVGETGTGKTTLVQHLANQVG